MFKYKEDQDFLEEITQKYTKKCEEIIISQSDEYESSSNLYTGFYEQFSSFAKEELKKIRSSSELKIASLEYKTKHILKDLLLNLSVEEKKERGIALGALVNAFKDVYYPKTDLMIDFDNIEIDMPYFCAFVDGVAFYNLNVKGDLAFGGAQNCQCYNGKVSGNRVFSKLRNVYLKDVEIEGKNAFTNCSDITITIDDVKDYFKNSEGLVVKTKSIGVDSFNRVKEEKPLSLLVEDEESVKNWMEKDSKKLPLKFCIITPKKCYFKQYEGMWDGTFEVQEKLPELSFGSDTVLKISLSQLIDASLLEKDFSQAYPLFQNVSEHLGHEKDTKGLIQEVLFGKKTIKEKYEKVLDLKKRIEDNSGVIIKKRLFDKMNLLEENGISSEFNWETVEKDIFLLRDDFEKQMRELNVNNIKLRHKNHRINKENLDKAMELIAGDILFFLEYNYNLMQNKNEK